MLRFLQNLKIWIFGKFLKFFGLDLEKKSTVLDGFFPYLAQIIISIRGCVACDDLWPWPIFSRSFGLDLENHVRSVASTVLDGFSPYLVQMITSMRRCVACHDPWPWPISSRSFDLVLTWGTQHDSIVWVIVRRRGVSSERRRSSCFSFCWICWIPSIYSYHPKSLHGNWDNHIISVCEGHLQNYLHQTSTKYNKMQAMCIFSGILCIL